MSLMTKSASGQACGKAILSGEHFVLFGSPALALPLQGMRTQVTLDLTAGKPLTLYSNGKRLHDPQANEMLRKAFRILNCPLGGTVNIQSTIPLGCGLGSSAALGVALIRGLNQVNGTALSAAEINDLAFELEKVAHGNPSGVDNTVVTFERAVRFDPGKKPVSLETMPMTLVIGDTGVRGETALAIEDVARWRTDNQPRFDEMLQESHRETEDLQRALRNGDMERGGLLMNRAHDRLQTIGVSHEALEKVREGALRAGAFGSKLTGAGRGGCVLSLVSEMNCERVQDSMMTAGANRCWVVQVGGCS